MASLLLATLLLVPGHLEAQALGLPVRNAGLPRGVSVAADLGVPNDASGLGTTLGASAGLGLGLLGLTATVARTDMTGQDAVISGGATVNWRLIGGPLVPFFATLQVGAGRWKSPSTAQPADVTSTTYSVGLGLGWTIASPLVSLKPWLAPRLQWNRISYPGYSGASSSNAAISAGIDLGFINGMSVRGMYDRVLNDEGADDSVWSVGLGYSLRIGR